jgi:hypothetical protein
MLARSIAFAAALTSASAPCLAAGLEDLSNTGARRSGAVVGAYYKVPLGAPDAGERAPRAGLRLAMTHDYRTPAAPTARLIHAEGIDLRLTGKQPALYLAGRPMTGEQARLEAGSGGGGRLDKVMLGAGVALAAVAGFVVFSSFD